jgi:hypothetical protein
LASFQQIPRLRRRVGFVFRRSSFDVHHRASSIRPRCAKQIKPAQHSRLALEISTIFYSAGAALFEQELLNGTVSAFRSVPSSGLEPTDNPQLMDSCGLG